MKPLLSVRCGSCHGEKKREGGLRFLSRSDILHLNDSGEPAIVAGKSAASELIRRVVSEDDDRMPPKGKRLSNQEVNLLRRWIDAGAEWKDSNKGNLHWAYQKPVRSALPEVANKKWLKNAVDNFVLARLEKENIAPAAQTDKARLLRRVYLDLVGLPPSVDEVDAFLNDSSDKAYERVVDRLLKSPRYGEHWAQRWLDLARYADSNGYQADQFRTMWAFRDWVINAMNEDMPFDQFTIEQLAGDMLPNATTQQKIATGFHRCTTCNVEAGVDPEENRVNQIIDRVNTTGTVWLGTSLECAQCHNHKSDPFTQQDYYQIFAFFNNTPMEVKLSSGVTYDFYGPKMDLPLDEVTAKQRKQLTADVEELTKRRNDQRAEAVKGQDAWEQRLQSAIASGPEYHKLDVEKFESVGGATHTVLDDNSLLIGGKNPQNDTYTITFRTEVIGITGFKLEALLDPSLPGKGPGRQTKQNRANFVLTDFRVTCKKCDDPEAKEEVVALANASADLNATRFEIDKALDNDPKTGWSIHTEIHKPHHAQFLTTEPVGFDAGTLLKFTLAHNYGEQRALGRFRLTAITGQPETPKVADDIVAIVTAPKKKRKKADVKKLRDFYLKGNAKLAALEKQLNAKQAELKKLTPDSTLVMIEMTETRMSNIFRRGNFLDKGAKVEAAAPAVLHTLKDGLPKNRIGLARWLVDPDNPLVARVTVNRWWSAFFGAGIVASLEDFGTQGEEPTHPELLDWLATEFVESGWSMKHMHRLIVLSATYQQSSRTRFDLSDVDPENKLLARGARVRMSAEMIRDNGLKISGLLTTKVGGPPIFPPQPPNVWRHIGRNAPKYLTSLGPDRFRRGVYVVWRRRAPYPNFVNFDAPDRAACVVERSRTNTPLQALTLMNDPAYVEMMQGLARRVARLEGNVSMADRIRFAFRSCLSRPPNDLELKVVENAYRQELARFQSNAAAAEAVVPKGERLEDIPLHELAAWYYVASILLNLDETITKG
ncbi:MAG: hypothetical protein CMJ78_11205 [Planctomycetaceae bacterium]|nr:hypothetical protein [Planctomycetaceae bacterium]